MKALFSILPLAAALALAACRDSQPAERRPLGSGSAGGLPVAVQAQVDSGNAAYRAQDYEGALRHYRAATRLGPDQAAPWFGVGMAAQALGNQPLADSAQARVRELSPGMSGEDAHHGDDPAVPPPPPPPRGSA